jgi:hypothetical protein
MADLAYREVYRTSRIEARLRLMTAYHQRGSIGETAGRRHASQWLARKRMKRYKAGRRLRFCLVRDAQFLHQC